MAKRSITGLAVEAVKEQTGFLGRKTVEDELLRMDTPGGSIFLKKSTVEAAGDSWQRLKHGLRAAAQEQQIPFEDMTE